MSHLVTPWGRLRALAQFLLSATALAALVAGIPWGLIWAAGTPWPSAVTSLSDLAERLQEPISDMFLTKTLALIAWVCWAAFVLSLIREAAWYAAHLPQLWRDRRVHHEHLDGLSMKGSLAAMCIGTLVIAVLGLWRPPTVSAQPPSYADQARPHTAATAPLLPAPGPRPRSAMITAAGSAAAMSSRYSPSRPSPADHGEAVRHFEYTVVEGDTLWDLARTHMGDPLKWPRIYTLNKDRVQRDGGRLRDPDLLMPGWQLTIPVAPTLAPQQPAPAPAQTAPAQTPPAPAAASPAPSDTAPTPATPQHHNDTADQAIGTHAPAPPSRQDRPATHARTTTATADAKPGPASIGLGEASLIGITAAAGLLATRRYWYLHQNRLREPDLLAEVPALSTLVSKAANAAHEAALPRPPHDPDALITRRTPPQPPRTPQTVTIGLRDETEVPLDELARPGGCTWTGPGASAAARALLVGILTAAERQRPAAPHVTAVITEDLAEHLLPGLPPQFTALTRNCDLAQAVQTAEQHLLAHAHAQEAQQEQDPDPIASTLAAGATAPPTSPGTLLLLTVPDAAHTGQLQALAARSNPDTLIVLTLNTPLPEAQHWHIASDGTATRQPDDNPTSPLRMFHLTPEAGRELTEVLLAAHGQRPRLRIIPKPQPAGRQPQPTSNPEEPEPEESEPAEPEPGPRNEPAPPTNGLQLQPPPQPEDTATHPYAIAIPRPRQAKPVRLHVFGPVTMYARGHRDPVGTNLRAEVHEFLALLAAHPNGLLAADIADKLRLAPGSENNALKNLRRAVRRALRAATSTTAQEFIVLQGEIHKLHPDLVETDLADFTGNLKKGLAAARAEGKDNAALPAVTEALAHYRGPFAQGGDYLWADTIREHLATQATDAALRLARSAERPDATPHERDDVLTLLEHLSAIHPDHERLAQHAIRLYQAAGRNDAARHTYTRLARHLADLGLEPEPGTQALVTLRTKARQSR